MLAQMFTLGWGVEKSHSLFLLLLDPIRPAQGYPFRIRRREGGKGGKLRAQADRRRRRRRRKGENRKMRESRRGTKLSSSLIENPCCPFSRQKKSSPRLRSKSRLAKLLSNCNFKRPSLQEGEINDFLCHFSASDSPYGSLDRGLMRRSRGRKKPSEQFGEGRDRQP